MPSTCERTELEFFLTSPTWSVRQARQLAQATVRQWFPDKVVETAGLLVSELASNAVRHVTGRACFRLVVLRTAKGLRAEVHDCGRGEPRVLKAGDGDEGGRGLALVELLSDAWGWTPTADGKAVWFELHERGLGQPARLVDLELSAPPISGRVATLSS